jgi:hypothetical protein
MRGLPADHAIHTGPLIRREHDYRLLDMPSRRSIFRVLVDFVRTCEVTHHSWVFSKRELGDTDRLVSAMSRELGMLIRSNSEFFSSWERIVIYYDNGQKEITNLVNSVFNAHLSVEVRKVVPADYSLFQAADLCCTLALLRQKIETGGLSPSERGFFSTPACRSNYVPVTVRRGAPDVGHVRARDASTDGFERRGSAAVRRPRAGSRAC